MFLYHNQIKQIICIKSNRFYNRFDWRSLIAATVEQYLCNIYIICPYRKNCAVTCGRPMNAPTGLQSKKSIKKRPPYWVDTLYVGISLFFRAVTSQVSSAPLSLTSVFGMGTGGPSASSTPTILLYLKAFQLFYLLVTRAGIEPALPA